MIGTIALLVCGASFGFLVGAVWASCPRVDETEEQRNAP